MGEVSGGQSTSRTKSSEKTSEDVDIPEWLMPFIQQGTDTASGALGNLEQLSGEDPVADMNSDQLQGLDAVRNMVGGDFFQTAQNTAMDTAQGGGLDLSFMDPALRESLMGGDFDLQSFIGNARDATAFTQNDTARDALESTAGGDYLYGGEGFNRAVDASVNAATPHIASAFGGSVGGAGGSGLAKSAVGQSAIDAFASQYGAERNRQMGAAGTLDAGGRADRGNFLNFAGGEKNRNQAGQGLLAGMTGEERNRQMRAAETLPDIGMLDANAQMRVGEYLQNQSQREIDGPMQQQLQLLMAALGVTGSQGGLYGSDRVQQNRGTNYKQFSEGSYSFGG